MKIEDITLFISDKLAESRPLRRTNFSSLIIILSLFLLSGCEFSPDDVPVTHITPPPEQGPPLKISLNDSSDTIRIGWETSFTYKITGTNKTISSVIVTLGDKELHHYIGEYGQTFDFMVDPALYGDGLYHLNINIMTSAGTGSIAEKLGAEGYLYIMDWPLVIDKTVPRKLNFISIDSVDKGIKITWEKFDHPSFGHYEITKSSTSFFGTQDLFVSDNPGVNSFTDTTYMEGMIAKYHVTLFGTFADFIYECTNEKVYYHLPGNPRIKYIKDFEIEMSWDPPKNAGILDYYLISGNLPVIGTLEDNMIYDPEIRTQRRYAIFGVTNNFGVKYIPKSEFQLYPDNMLGSYTGFTLGEEMPSYSYAFPIPDGSYVLLSDKGILSKYDFSVGNTAGSIRFNSQPADQITLSRNGKFFGYSEEGKFIRRNTKDLAIVSVMTNDEFESNSQNLAMLSISDTNLLLTVTKDYKLTVYNLTTGLKIAEKRFDGISVLRARISPEGMNILTMEYDRSIHVVYYRITGDQITEQARVNESDLNFGAKINYPFGPDNDIYIIFPGKIEIRNIGDFSVKKILNLSGIESVDYQAMKAFGKSQYPELAYLYDLETGIVVKNLMVDNLTELKLHQNFLFYSGRVLNLNNIH